MNRKMMICPKCSCECVVQFKKWKKDKKPQYMIEWIENDKIGCRKCKYVGDRSEFEEKGEYIQNSLKDFVEMIGVNRSL